MLTNLLEEVLLRSHWNKFLRKRPAAEKTGRVGTNCNQNPSERMKIFRRPCFLAIVSAVFLTAFQGSIYAQTQAGQGEAAKGSGHEVLFAEDIYPSAKTCAECHPKQYSEWSVSQHAYSQMSPIYMAMQMRINTLTSGTNGDFCVRCHNQIGMNMGEPVVMPNLERPASSREGITCSVCHRVNKSYGKISGRLPLVRGPMESTIFGPTGGDELRYVIDDPDQKGFRVVTDPIERGHLIHSEAEPFFELTKPGFCGDCHDVTLLNGFRLEEAFSEFKQTEAAANGTTCQDCHMGKSPGEPSGYEVGPAALVNGVSTKPRKLTNHFFAGPDYSLVHPGLFPHSVEATDFASLEDWLEFDWRAGWGTPDFEDTSDDAFDAFEALRDALDPENDDALEIEEVVESAEILEEAVEASIFPDAQGLYEDMMASVGALAQAAEENRDTVSLAEDVLSKTNRLSTTMKFDFPETWSDAGDREDAREFLDEQLDRLKWAEEQRLAVLRVGYKLDDIVIDSSGPDGLRFHVDVRNGTNGHGVPTGFDAERLVFLQVTVTDSQGRVVYKSGDRDPNGDVRDSHSLYVHNGELPVDGDLFNLQSKFIVRLLRGGEREQVLAVNTSVSALPFVRPETRATVVFGRPLGARKHKKTIEPLGTRRASYAVSGDDLDPNETYRIEVGLVAQMIPVHLIAAIQESGFDYGLTPKQLAERVVEGAQTLWERTATVKIE